MSDFTPTPVKRVDDIEEAREEALYEEHSRARCDECVQLWKYHSGSGEDTECPDFEATLEALEQVEDKLDHIKKALKKDTDVSPLVDIMSIVEEW